jgi:uncharacterized protein (TIGR03435 family)
MTSGLLLALALMQAQPAFDVASVKRAAPITTDSYNINLGKTLNGELTMGNVTLGECLKFAYGFTDNIQLDGPDWMNRKGDVLFDIVARTSPDVPRDQMRLMLRTLLKERFELVTHTEERQASYLALVQGKKGLKLVESDPAAVGGPDNIYHLGHIDSKRADMSTIATILSRFMRHPVLDQTGLKGNYVVKLDWTFEPEDPQKAAGTDSGPSIYTALQEQLGLRLESRKGPLEVLVIDSARKEPIAN